MSDYPVFRPEKYSGVNLILSNSAYDYRPYQGQTQQYSSYQPTQSKYAGQYGSNPISSNSKIIYRNKNKSSPVGPKPQGTSKAEERIKGELIKGTSRIQYVPVEKKVVDYVDETRYSLVPRKRIVTDYRDYVRVDIVPREVIYTDYYAIQHIRSYIPQVIPESYIEYVPVEHKNIKYEYIPVQRQLVHYPEHSLEAENTRYLGIREGPKIYQNVPESQIQFWEKQYGYVRGQSIAILNEKIRLKNQRQKQRYFKQFQSVSTVQNSPYASKHYNN